MFVTGADAQAELTPSPPARRPARSRYWLAALVGIAGITVAFGCALAAQAALSSRADGFLRTSVPGEITVRVEHAATYYVYAEGTLWRHPSVRVTDPAGRAVPVKATSSGPHYYHGGSGGGAIVTFDATRAGDYRVAAATGTAVQGDFAVGGRFPLWLRLSDAGVLTLMVLSVGSSVVLVVVTAIRRRRHED